MINLRSKKKKKKMTTEKKRKEKKINDFKKKGALKQKANSE